MCQSVEQPDGSPDGLNNKDTETDPASRSCLVLPPPLCCSSETHKHKQDNSVISLLVHIDNKLFGVSVAQSVERVSHVQRLLPRCRAQGSSQTCSCLLHVIPPLSHTPFPVISSSCLMNKSIKGEKKKYSKRYSLMRVNGNTFRTKRTESNRRTGDNFIP